jgi:polysaccharide deacetylase family protein (PEP-CTERM system associated)
MPMILGNEGLNLRTIETVRDGALPGMDYWLSPAPPTTVSNALTIDLEDWPVAVLGPSHEISARVVENTRRCLQILRWHHVKATFFVLGRVAEQFPALVREVHAAGHEIAAHGYNHELLTNLTPQRFEADVRRSLDILTRLVGEPPVGYRAPAFSIVESTRWAGPILAGLGLKYSSSVFPIRHPRYGIADAPRHIHRWRDCRLIECPPATFRFFGRNWPVGGGGYFRLLPGPVARVAIRRLNRAQLPAILYLHPYELDVDGVSAHKRAGLRVGWRRQLTQQMFRGRTECRLHRLCEQFRFTTLRDLLKHAV